MDSSERRGKREEWGQRGTISQKKLHRKKETSRSIKIIFSIVRV